MAPIPGDTGAAVVEDTAGSPACDDAWAGNLTMNSTQDMAAFCGAYRSVTGSLEVSGVADSVDLTGLSCLCEVGAELRMLHSPQVGSLAGLESLTHVGRSLILGDDLALTDLTGAAPHALAVKRSDRFASLEGLDWIDSLETLELEELPRLTSLRGLDGLTER